MSVLAATIVNGGRTGAQRVEVVAVEVDGDGKAAMAPRRISQPAVAIGGGPAGGRDRRAGREAGRYSMAGPAQPCAITDEVARRQIDARRGGLKICRYLLLRARLLVLREEGPPPDGHEGIEDNRRPIGGEGVGGQAERAAGRRCRRRRGEAVQAAARAAAATKAASAARAAAERVVAPGGEAQAAAAGRRRRRRGTGGATAEEMVAEATRRWWWWW